MAKRRKKYSLFDPKTGKYASGDNGALRWTYDLESAKESAKYMGCIVVDTLWLSKHWAEWQETKVIPESALA